MQVHPKAMAAIADAIQRQETEARQLSWAKRTAGARRVRRAARRAC